MKILTFLQLLSVLIATGNSANNRLEWMEQATHSVSSSIDRPPASPGPHYDVTAGALVAPDLNPSANIHPIYTSNLEPLTRFINHHPHHRDSREFVTNPGLEYYSFSVDKKKPGMTTQKRSASRFQDPPANLQESLLMEKLDSFDSIIQAMEEKEREYMKTLAQIIKYISPEFEGTRPDGFPIQGTEGIPSSHPSYGQSVFVGKHKWVSVLMRLLENLIRSENNGVEDELKSKQTGNFYLENGRMKIPTDPENMLLEGEMSPSDYKIELPDSSLTKYLSQFPQHWATDRSTKPLTSEIVQREYESMTKNTEIIPAMKEEKVHTAMNNIYDVKEHENEFSRTPFEATATENSIENERNPISFPEAIKDRHTRKYLSQGTGKNQIPYYITEKANEVISGLSKPKDLFGKELKNLYSNEKKYFSILKERVNPIRKAILLRKDRIIRNYYPFDPYNISNLPGPEYPLKPTLQLVSDKNDEPKKMSYESNLELPHGHYSNGFQKTRKSMNTPIKTNLIKLQSVWEPTQYPSSILSLPLMEILLQNPERTEELLDILENQEAKGRTRKIPIKYDYSREVNMLINQDTMKLPPGSKEIIEGGAGVSPGKHEGGGFKLKINIPR